MLKMLFFSIQCVSAKLDYLFTFSVTNKISSTTSKQRERDSQTVLSRSSSAPCRSSACHAPVIFHIYPHYPQHLPIASVKPSTEGCKMRHKGREEPGESEKREAQHVCVSELKEAGESERLVKLGSYMCRSVHVVD